MIAATRSFVAIVLACLSFSIGCTAVHAQTAGDWCPSNNPGLTVRDVWYDTRSNWGSQSRIGMTSSDGRLWFYYFSTSDAVQLQLSNTMYASLLSAEISGQPVFLILSQGDPYNSGAWDFISMQVGPN